MILLLKKLLDNKMPSGHIYLVIIYGENYKIYKIGKSIQIDIRIKSYNCSKPLNITNSNDIDYDESELIKIFNENCTLYKGREYFTGESDEFMLKLFLNYFINKKCETKTIIDKKIQEVKEVPEVTEVKEVQEIQEVPEVILNNLEDRTCTNCNKIFIYPTELRKHFKNTICCKKSDEDIKDFFIQIKINKQEQDKNRKHKCNNCNTIFVQKCTLTRHMKNSKCNKDHKEKIIKIKILQKQIDELNKT